MWHTIYNTYICIYYLPTYLKYIIFYLPTNYHLPTNLPNNQALPTTYYLFTNVLKKIVKIRWIVTIYIWWGAKVAYFFLCWQIQLAMQRQFVSQSGYN